MLKLIVVRATLQRSLRSLGADAHSTSPPPVAARSLRDPVARDARVARLGGNNRARDGCWLLLVVVEVSCTCQSAREILTAGAEGHTDSSLEKAGARSNPGTRPWIPKVVQQEKATWLRAL